MCNNNKYGKDRMEFLKQLLYKSSPSGQEYTITSCIQDNVKDTLNTELDTIGNLYVYKGESDFTVMIIAHCDEVGFQITKIDENGFARVRRIGGTDRYVLPGAIVTTSTKGVSVSGVIGKKSPHSQNEKDRSHFPELASELFVDFGFSSKNEAEKYIHIGQCLSFAPCFLTLNNGKKIVSKGLDNKIGVYVMIECLNRISIDSTVAVVGVATAQEEIGGRGSYIASIRKQPDVVFVVDCGVATDIPANFDSNYPELFLGKGPAICINADNNREVTDILMKCAEVNGIPYQLYPGNVYSGGNEASMVWNSYKVKVANIFLPVRYMHSNSEMCDWNDVNNSIELLSKTIDFLVNNL